ncbi:hypothetical protein [Virgibacillus sp. SK37]|uniref:hypothetical protein n=1 Tax=Virgibacillus sp. SK37 TaxID=403957 RepID=UPI0004D1ADAB|nr:hypothetical protein [Virgibacillus sp. SK37]AIF45627.1 hypothetical protein X953_18325 [Virgibacillus sp. SK37]
MRRFFQNAMRVSLTSLAATLVVTVILMVILNLATTNTALIHSIGKTYIALSLPFLILNPIFGFIYSFKINDPYKILYILLHFASICTISVVALLGFMFRYFVSFAP